MENKITENEPAMPCSEGDFTGLTIRQYFAAMAMQGILANSEFLANYQNVDIHAMAVHNADHLINALNKDKEK